MINGPNRGAIWQLRDLEIAEIPSERHREAARPWRSMRVQQGSGLPRYARNDAGECRHREQSVAIHGREPAGHGLPRYARDDETAMDEVSMPLSAKASQRGFSLIEIALVLVIVGLMLGGMVAGLGPWLENKKVSDTEERIKQASDAILAYAMVNRRIPCPATATSNGLEVLAAGYTTEFGKCANPYDGFVPARTLGLGDQNPKGLVQDPWSYALRYGVSHLPYLSPGSGVGLECPSTKPCYSLTRINGLKKDYPTWIVPVELVVCASSTGITATTCGTPEPLAQAGFVVWSTARNGAKSLGPTPAGDGQDENANLNGDVVYVFHPRTDAGPPVPPNGAFDDLFRWQTIITIISNMTKL